MRLTNPAAPLREPGAPVALCTLGVRLTEVATLAALLNASESVRVQLTEVATVEAVVSQQVGYFDADVWYGKGRSLAVLP